MFVSLSRVDGYWEREIWAVRDDAGAIAGTLLLAFPMSDNTSRVEAGIGVRADVRRRGYGAALARTAEERATEYGRTVVVSALPVPFDAVGDTPGQAFARRFGLSVANVEVHRVLELPLDEGLLDELAQEAARYHEGYELRSWQDRCPEDLIDAYAALQATFNLEAPQGELEVEAQAYDAARVRSTEDHSLEQGRHGWMTVAIAPDGTLAGHTELYHGENDPGNVYQWGTLVSPAHRGHRLGLALKVRNHRELQRSRPQPLVAHTFNAETNTAMNAVNARLGFRPVERAEEWQRKN
ncbi:acetyltransferase (GNAT) family protein [Kribbella amoyensis]|uniref:Acetyltransferase (GNAT) family protein n=2 Tax=Kribbella amoyensis TaxID=996641 RepID=A0A561BKT6_9ACTN|nr:acetyltransferase (GNAT) family protein [Kribbella amoyensis]